MNGYVFVVNNHRKYLDLLGVALDSVLSFSDKNIEVFGINFDYPSTNPRVMSKRIDIRNENFDGICFVKYDAMLRSQFDTGIYLDTDIVATRDTNKLFLNDNLITKYPLLPLHPQDDPNIHYLMSLLGIPKKTQHYVHASIYIFNRRCREFLIQCRATGQYLINHNASSFAGDEGITNCLLWKDNAIDAFMRCCDPNYINFEWKLYDGKDDNESLYYTSHGCKDLERAKKILNHLKGKNGLP